MVEGPAAFGRAHAYPPSGSTYQSVEHLPELKDKDTHRVGRPPSSAGTPDWGVATFEGAAFVLGHSTPHSVVLAGFDSPFQAGRSDLTAMANGLCFSVWRSAGPVFPSGKNSSGFSPRQAARLRQVTIVGLLESRSGESASCESLRVTSGDVTSGDGAHHYNVGNTVAGVDNPSCLSRVSPGWGGHPRTRPVTGPQEASPVMGAGGSKPPPRERARTVTDGTRLSRPVGGTATGDQRQPQRPGLRSPKPMAPGGARADAAAWS